MRANLKKKIGLRSKLIRGISMIGNAGFEYGPNGTYCCYVWYVTLISRVGRMPRQINRHNSLTCTVGTSRQKGWLSVL